MLDKNQPGLNAKKATLRQGQPSLPKTTSADTEMNTSNLLNKPDNNDTTDADVQAVLAPLVGIIDQFQRVHYLGQVGEFDVIAIRREPEEFGASDAEFLRDVIAFCGGEELALCEVQGAAGSRSLQVAGSSRGLTKALRTAPSDGVGTGLRVEWICPVSGNAFPVPTLGHLLDVVSTFARRGVGKVTA
ncbi:hypothetical protein [Methylobacterium soli]|uniref:Uncharacterized protein n=1 Tax=Methylobacterium soli TaxID=553447 RepID=A0A6L3SU35_9HYPH|nr:hypothetical protein [Methylobacterium soli]KAB1075927.1 hypothetical protein F6X53_24155 [Methylobacterium soli]GJE41867.1 hypothetical protein AEGHOMDF_1037 [Methylobacterium soli]